MKKICILLATIGLALGARAQEGNYGLVYPNSFYGSFAVGANLLHTGHESSFGVPSVNLTGGVWLASPLAFQIALDGALNDGQLLALVSAEFKWDVNSTFFHVYSNRFLKPIPFYTTLGLGMSVLSDMEDAASHDNSFQVSLGLQVPCRLTDHTDAILQYRCVFMPQGFAGSHGDNFFHTFGLGLQYRQSADPYHRRTERYTRSIGEDWFISLGVGPNYSSFEPFTNPNAWHTEMIGWAPEVAVGRNFSNFWSVRFVLNGLSAHEQYDTVHSVAGQSYSYSFLHADLMLNVSSIISRGYGVRFNVMPYLGAGPVWRYDVKQFDVGADWGVQLRYYLSRRSDIYLDARYVMVAPSIGGGEGPKGKYYGVGLPSITLGYIYNFGHNTTRYRIPLDELKR